MSFWESLNREDIWMLFGAFIFGYGFIFFLNPEFIWNLDHLDKIMVSFALGILPFIAISLCRRLHDTLHHTPVSSEYVEKWHKGTSTLLIFIGPILIALRLVILYF